MSNRNLAACYDTVIYFQDKGKPRQYIKAIGKDLLEFIYFTENLDEAKLFRPHVGWAGEGIDYDSYHNAFNILVQRLRKDDKYRVALGNEIFDETNNQTVVAAMRIEPTDRLTTVLMPQE